MAFDPTSFFSLANKFHLDAGHGDEDECKIRTAIGRAYYSAFLCARNTAKLTDTSTKIHEITASWYIDQGKTGIGNRLNELRVSRNRADYDCALKFVKKDSGKALSQAANILTDLGIPTTSQAKPIAATSTTSPPSGDNQAKPVA